MACLDGVTVMLHWDGPSDDGTNTWEGHTDTSCGACVAKVAALPPGTCDDDSTPVATVGVVAICYQQDVDVWDWGLSLNCTYRCADGSVGTITDTKEAVAPYTCTPFKIDDTSYSEAGGTFLCSCEPDPDDCSTTDPCTGTVEVVVTRDCGMGMAMAPAPSTVWIPPTTEKPEGCNCQKTTALRQQQQQKTTALRQQQQKLRGG